jgi:hypothetical protein
LNGPPFTLEEVSTAVRLAYDEPMASEQLALWTRVYASHDEDPSASAVWFFPVELVAALVVARPETAARAEAARPHGDAAFNAEVERAWQGAMAWARTRAGILPSTPFGFNATWYVLGIATPERLAALQAEWECGEDRSPEHYRWRAFREFLAANRPLTERVATAIFHLGANDVDHAMGAAIMHEVVALPECPQAILEAARASGRKDLVRLVDSGRQPGDPR